MSIYDFTLDELENYLVDNGFKKYNATQIFEGIYKKRVSSFDEITNISKELKTFLNNNFEIKYLKVLDELKSEDTNKYLLEVKDSSIEVVLMKHDYGNSICISTQIGCNMGCAFCASGLTKKRRDLTSGEMVAQFLNIQRELDKEDQRLSHIVVMGTGEPFDNYENVMNFLATVNHDRGLGIGSRHITISTCGVVPRIYEFADEHTQYNLAVSLHAPNDELRSRLMPINKAYPLSELMKAIRYYGQENNRRLTFEYILLKGINDQPQHARQLAKLLHGLNAYVNLIPYNSVDEKQFKSVTREEAMVFYDLLMKNHVRCTIRKEHGQDIDAACGQLRINEIKKGLGQ